MKLRRGLWLALLGTTACGPPPAPAELVAFEHTRQLDDAAHVRQRQPVLVADSDRYFEAARGAWRDGREEAEILHLTRMARIRWRTAEAYSHVTDLNEVVATSDRTRAVAERELAVAQAQQAAAERDAMRLTEMIGLRKQLGDARQSARIDHRAAEARKKVEAAATYLRQVEAMDVERLAPGPLARARQSMKNAFAAFNEGRYPEASAAADLALADVGTAAAAAAPAWQAEEGQRRVDAELFGMLEAAARVGPARLEARGLVVTVRDVFRKGKLVPSPEKLKLIEGFAREHPTFRLVVEGHTDNRGAPATLQQQSEAQAQAFAHALEADGLREVTAVGRGDQEPVGDNTTRTGRQRNQRLEVLFVRPVVVPKSTN